MTDGCGYINLFPLRLLQAQFGWEEFPTAIQFRIEALDAPRWTGRP